MVLLRGFIHLLALVALAVVALAFGRWLRDPAGVGAFALLAVSVVVVAACLSRLYGRNGLVGFRRRAPRPEAAPPPATPSGPLWAGKREAAAAPAAPLAGPAAPLAVDLNRATRAELLSLPGVGPVAASRLEAARPFASVEDLARVPGFGPARMRALSDRVKI